MRKMLSYNSGIKNISSGCKISGFKFSEHTTYGLGGFAKLAYLPENIYQAKRAVDECVESGKDYVALGNGSNVLVSDRGFSGNVICTKDLKGIVNLGNGDLFCLSGTAISSVISYCLKNGLGGLEYMYGIPATIGGAACMNAGVCNNAISDNIKKVVFYNGALHILTNKECCFKYRQSTMRDVNGLILAVIVNTNQLNFSDSVSRIKYFRNRRTHLPAGKSCGCVFKNPDGVSAGYLIEKCGLKGKRIGGAYVSEQHANFIISDSATSSDVKKLIEYVKRSVYIKFGVALSEEVVYIGDFNDSDC